MLDTNCFIWMPQLLLHIWACTVKTTLSKTEYINLCGQIIYLPPKKYYCNIQQDHWYFSNKIVQRKQHNSISFFNLKSCMYVYINLRQSCTSQILDWEFIQRWLAPALSRTWLPGRLIHPCYIITSFHHSQVLEWVPLSLGFVARPQELDLPLLGLDLVLVFLQLLPGCDVGVSHRLREKGKRWDAWYPTLPCHCDKQCLMYYITISKMAGCQNIFKTKHVNKY